MLPPIPMIQKDAPTAWVGTPPSSPRPGHSSDRANAGEAASTEFPTERSPCRSLREVGGGNRFDGVTPLERHGGAASGGEIKICSG